MNNELLLNELQNSFPNLRYFKLSNNVLSLEFDGSYRIPFINTSLSNINPNLFLQNPKEIFNILYMLELLNKNELNESEIAFITSFVNRYLKYSDLATKGNEVDKDLLWCLSIPIYTSYDPNYIENMGSSIIQNIINSHSEEIENSKCMHERLVLTHPDFGGNYEEDTFSYLEKAGFATLTLIGGAITFTLLFIIFFIVKY